MCSNKEPEKPKINKLIKNIQVYSERQICLLTGSQELMPLWSVNHKVMLGSEPSLTKVEQANMEGTKPGRLPGHHSQGTAAACMSGSLQVKEHLWETNARGYIF